MPGSSGQGSGPPRVHEGRAAASRVRIVSSPFKAFKLRPVHRSWSASPVSPAPHSAFQILLNARDFSIAAVSGGRRCGTQLRHIPGRVSEFPSTNEHIPMFQLCHVDSFYGFGMAWAPRLFILSTRKARICRRLHCRRERQAEFVSHSRNKATMMRKQIFTVNLPGLSVPQILGI